MVTDKQLAAERDGAQGQEALAPSPQSLLSRVVPQGPGPALLQTCCCSKCLTLCFLCSCSPERLAFNKNV